MSHVRCEKSCQVHFPRMQDARDWARRDAPFGAEHKPHVNSNHYKPTGNASEQQADFFQSLSKMQPLTILWDRKEPPPCENTANHFYRGVFFFGPIFPALFFGGKILAGKFAAVFDRLFAVLLF